jgi:anti-sigma B factor antagonist
VGELTIEAREEAGASVLALAGEFDLAVVELFEQAIAKLERAESPVVVVDLSAVEFMDSSGLRALVLADRRAQAAGRRLAIVPGPPTVRRVFELTQLEDRLDLIESVSEL